MELVVIELGIGGVCFGCTVVVFAEDMTGEGEGGRIPSSLSSFPF